MNPLLETHLSNNAETQFYDQIEIVSTFGIPQLEYAAIRKSCAMIDLPQRGILELSGRDRHAFLNNLVSNEIWDKSAKIGMPDQTTRYAFLLNLKGRVVLDLTAIEIGNRLLLEMDVRLVEMLGKLLDRYLFTEQVRIFSKVGSLHQIGLHGPRIGDLLNQEGFADFITSDAQAVAGRIMGTDIIIWRNDLCGVPGVNLVVPTDNVQAIWTDLSTRYGVEIDPGKRLLRPAGWAAFNSTRIEAGTPLFGIDFELAEPALPGAKKDADDQPRPQGVLPAETGLLHKAVSFTKGCYLGQEVVARMHARGQVARKLVGLKTADGALPISGEKVFDDADNQIGIITSSTMSPVLSDSAIALALVRKPHFETGRSVIVPAEGKMRTAQVVDLPFL